MSYRKGDLAGVAKLAHHRARTEPGFQRRLHAVQNILAIIAHSLPLADGHPQDTALLSIKRQIDSIRLGSF